MVTLPDYKNLIQIHQSDNSLVYRARRTENNQPVILKLLDDDYPTAEQIRRYKQEYHLTCQLDSLGIIKAYALEEWQRSYVIVLEDFGGISLKEWLKEREKLSLEEFLFLAISTTESLGEIHGLNIIHKDINPANIVFNSETKEVKIIDFGIATQLSRENPILKNPKVLEGTLVYISPEQTGRMNRSLDYRTDFYSLGVTFYELLTKQLPFITEDPLELVHSHLAKQPISPSEIDPSIPIAISEIVMKLMAKNPQERYQTSWGLIADLETCWEQLKSTGKIEVFPLASQDISDRFSLPQKLYGREKEIATLLAAFERVAEAGKVELMMVAGYSGIGKSCLVREIYKPITEKRGYFISGKFDQFQRNIPYSAVVAAFSDLVRQLLTETEAQLQQWRAKIEEALGTNGRVIIDAIPEVELIIGPQPEVVELGPTESQNRFNLVFDKFIRAFCDRSHPLVIFWDDLQWADSATLKLIELMMDESDTQYLLLIGAYRDNEVDSVHPLTLTLEKLRERQATVEQITLKPLSSSHINELIADTLQSEGSVVEPLTELVEQKTGGNPFFVNQFLTTLYEEQLVQFEGKSWQWELAKIKGMVMADNVVELMVGKLKKLPQKTQQVLSEAACIGAGFSLSLIGAIYQQSDRAELYQRLLPGVQSGLIVPTSTLDADLLIEEYKFVHDRVQQAAYSILPESEKLRTHYLLGRVLLDNSTPEELEEKLFEIADHLNAGIELATSPAEAEEIAQLNLRVGQKAKAATAYTAAANYLQTGREILTDSGWESQYQLMLDLHLVGVEVAYLGGDYGTMHSLFAVVDNRARTVLERVKAYEVLIQFYCSQNQMSVAISTGLEVLSMLGIELVESPPAYQDPAELYDREVMRDPTQLSALKIMANLFGAAYITDQQLLSQLILTMHALCWRHGNSELASYTYIMYGFLLCSTEEIELGYEYGKLGLNLVEKFNAQDITGKLRHVYYVHIHPYKESWRSGLEPLTETIKISTERGDFEYGSYTSTDSCIHTFFSGIALESVLRHEINYINYAKKTKQEYAFIHNRIWAQLTENLMGEARAKTELVGTWIDEKELIPILEEKNSQNNLCRFYLLKAILSYTLKDFSAGLTYIQKARTYESSIRGTIGANIIDFYHSLFLLALYSSSDRNSGQEYLEQVTLNQEKMKVLAKHAPMNFQHKYDLVEAEKARVLGEVALAMQLYEGAISGAKENLYLQEEALAYELAAEFYLSLGMVRFAGLYMKEAHYCYTRWGAGAKVEDLSQRYPQLLSQTTVANKDNLTDIVRKTSTGKTVSKVLDLETVMQANQAISGKIMLDELLAQLMKIALYNAGAQAGCLILDSDGQLLIQASGEMDNDKITVLQSLPTSDRVPEGIVNYVARTRSTLVLNDASKEGNFINEPYIKARRTKSVLCLPLVDGGKLVGVVYLENNLTTGAFTTDRLEILQLLSGQAAIAIANARLYSQLEDYSRTLEQKVEERTAQLAEATRKAEAANEAKSAFLANMSHELRTPLNAILGFSQLLIRNQNIPPTELENVGIIARSGEHLLTLINQVLDLSKIEAGRITLNPKNFDLYRLLDDIAGLLGLKASEKGLQLVWERDDNTPRYINTDEMKLRQVLINLINNAIKFTSEGGVAIGVRLKNENSPHIELEFKITDTGAGIAPEEIDGLFEAFVQTETGKQSQEGTGLGLPISRKFVQLMGGDIVVTSEVGRGTTFKFNIEATLADSEDLEIQKPMRRAIALAPNQPRYRLLVVDDKPVNCQLLLKLLVPFGFEVRDAANGREAVDIYTEWQPDLIFMDLRMSVMDGYEATRQIKAAAGDKPCAVVAVTASVLEEEKAVVLEAGCDDFIRKPFKDVEILEAIARHLGAEFIYEDPGEAGDSEEEALTARALAAVSEELLTALEEGLLTLEQEVMQEVVDAIADTAPTVARQLESLLKSFAYQQIVDLIEESKQLSN